MSEQRFDSNRGERSEFVDKLVGVRRVAKTVKGGRRMSFGALVIVGDEAGRVGFGQGKAKEVPDAVKKATDGAKRTMVRVPLRQGRTVHHMVNGQFGATKVMIRPAVPGTGIIAGGPMRAVFEAMGIKDVVAKAQGSTNPYNLIRATFAAFAAMETPRGIAAKRGLKITDLGLHAKDAARGEGDPKEMLAKAEKAKAARAAREAANPERKAGGRDGGRGNNRGRPEGNRGGGDRSRTDGNSGGRGQRTEAPKVVTVSKADSMVAATEATPETPKAE